MSPAGICDCAKEGGSPLTNVPALVDGETVITVVRSRHQLYRDETGIWRLSHSAFRREDIEAKKKGKSVSLMRETIIPCDEVTRRAMALSQDSDLAGGPLVAKASALKLRTISSAIFTKCVCLYADPITAEEAKATGDPLGECLGHASLKKHCTFSGANNPEAWGNLISDLADAFEGALHVLTGSAASFE